MREIKFRAWYKDFNQMVEVDEIHFDNNKIFEIIQYDEPITEGCPEPIDKFIIMQYTGLKDKNGKEIYEGDIIERESYVGIEDGIVVKFGWHGVVQDRSDFYGYPLAWAEEDFNKEICSKIKIIGNIYENSNLLEE